MGRRGALPDRRVEVVHDPGVGLDIVEAADDRGAIGRQVALGARLDQQVARIGRLAFRLPGSYTHMTVSRDGRWALATQMVRFDSDLMRLDNFR